MAENSIREQIIAQVVSELENIDGINVVQRTLPMFDQLKEFPSTVFPLAVVVGGLPKPVTKRTGRTGHVDHLTSQLTIDVNVYFVNSGDPDTLISNLADDIWIKLWTDQTKGGLVRQSEVEFLTNPVHWEPFIAFKMRNTVTYEHDTGGI